MKIWDEIVKFQESSWEFKHNTGLKIAGIMFFILGILGNLTSNISFKERLFWLSISIIGIIILVYTFLKKK